MSEKILTDEDFKKLAEFRRTPLGAAISDFYSLLNNLAPRIGKTNYEQFEKIMERIKKEINAMRKICVHCDEEIKPYEVIPDAEGKLHRECLLRSVAGSVAHQQQKCSCFGGTGEDDPDLTTRENAKAAFEYFCEFRRKSERAALN